MRELTSTCGTMTVQVEGVLDPRAASRTLARVAELACDDVVLDLGAAREISDVALAYLAGGLGRLPRSHVVLRGLGSHHEHVLRELGAGALVGTRQRSRP